MTKDEYIGRYVGKKMKNNKLPYGLAYLNLVADYEETAEKNWNAMIRKKIREYNQNHDSSYFLPGVKK